MYPQSFMKVCTNSLKFLAKLPHHKELRKFNKNKNSTFKKKFALYIFPLHNWHFIQDFSLQVARGNIIAESAVGLLLHLKVSYNNKCFESLDIHSNLKSQFNIGVLHLPWKWKRKKNHLFNFKVLFKLEHPRTNIFIILFLLPLVWFIGFYCKKRYLL